MTARIPLAPFYLAASAVALLAGAPAGAAVSDFRLPPSDPSPTPRPQGPVDPDNPVARPSTAPTPSPSPAVVGAPSATPSPRLTLPSFSPTPRATATRRPVPVPSASAAAPRATETAAPVPATLPSAFPSALPTAPSAPAPAPDDGEDGLPWQGILLGLGLAAVAALAGAAWHWRRRFLPRRGMVLVVPEIEKPRVPAPVTTVPEPEAPAAPPPPEEPTHPLLIAITPVKLTQTFMNAALSYRLSLTNVGAGPVGPIAVAADLFAAHAAMSREEQLAGPATTLPERHSLPGIAPGEQAELVGEIRTPLAELPVIQQGPAALLVPLARFRVTAPGVEPRHFTLAVGQQVPGAAGLAPIRLDLGPRTTDGLAGRAF